MLVVSTMYRSISLFKKSFVDKILQKWCINDDIVIYNLTVRKFLSYYQYGIKLDYNNDLALLSMIGYVPQFYLLKMASVLFFMFIDLRKAFVMLHYDILLNKLKLA